LLEGEIALACLRVNQRQSGNIDNLSKAGWSWGCVSAIDSNGRTIWIADAHLDDEKRFVVPADEKLTAFVELQSAIRAEKIAVEALAARAYNRSQCRLK